MIPKQFIILGLVFGLKYLPPLENYINIILPVYVITNVVLAATYYILMQRVANLPEKERTKKIYPSNKNRKDLKEGDVKTLEEYDTAELKQALQRIAFQTVFSLFLWYKWDFVRHFVMQFATLVLTALMEDEMIKHYIFGQPIDRSKPKNVGFMDKLKEQLEEQKTELQKQLETPAEADAKSIKEKKED